MTANGRVKQLIFVEISGQVCRPTDFVRVEFSALPDSSDLPDCGALSRYEIINCGPNICVSQISYNRIHRQVVAKLNGSFLSPLIRFLLLLQTGCIRTEVE
jgi:hypothetical protein